MVDRDDIDAHERHNFELGLMAVMVLLMRMVVSMIRTVITITVMKVLSKSLGCISDRGDGDFDAAFSRPC